MSRQREIRRTVTLASPAPGFAGPGHTAVAVISPADFAENDPFIALMDDRVADRNGGTIGDAHPHAGIETVTLMLAGKVKDGDAPALGAGDAQWMTAGSGIVHDEEAHAFGDIRLLQLWVTLPTAERAAEPRFQDIHLRDLPVRRENGAEIRLYSGASGGLTSPTLNHVPVTLADIHLAAGASVQQDLPASYNGFVYVLDGAVRIGAQGTLVRAGEVGWLDRPAGDGPSELRTAAEGRAARLVLYAGEPQGGELVQRGPLAANSKEDLADRFRAYRNGRFPRLSDLAREKYGVAPRELETNDA